MSHIMAKLLQTAARTGAAAAEGFAQRKRLQGTTKRGGRKQRKAGCTPCEAMARVEAAKKATRGS